jgi:hypothetical protein
MRSTILSKYFFHLTLGYSIFQFLQMKLKICLFFEAIFFMFNKHQYLSFDDSLILWRKINKIIDIIILIIFIAFKNIRHDATNILKLILSIIIDIPCHLHIPNFNTRSLVIFDCSKAYRINGTNKSSNWRIYFFDIDFSLINTR